MLKTILLMGACFMALPTMAANTTPVGSCANGGGAVYLGKDGTRYCISHNNMNWWSAFAWCDAAGGRLISTQDCNGTSGNVTGTTRCPNFETIFLNSVFVWTSTISDANSGYSIALYYDFVPSQNRRTKHRAMCKF